MHHVTVFSAGVLGVASAVTVLYFVRHGEVDPTDRVFPLSSAGKLRALAFADPCAASL